MFGPLSDGSAVAKTGRYLELGRQEGGLAYSGKLPPAELQQGGHYFAQAIFTGILPHHRLAREGDLCPYPGHRLAATATGRSVEGDKGSARSNKVTKTRSHKPVSKFSALSSTKMQGHAKSTYRYRKATR